MASLFVLLKDGFRYSLVQKEKLKKLQVGKKKKIFVLDQSLENILTMRSLKFQLGHRVSINNINFFCCGVCSEHHGYMGADVTGQSRRKGLSH